LISITSRLFACPAAHPFERFALLVADATASRRLQPGTAGPSSPEFTVIVAACAGAAATAASTAPSRSARRPSRPRVRILHARIQRAPSSR